MREQGRAWLPHTNNRHYHINLRIRYDAANMDYTSESYDCKRK